jgi:hypothetical protein
MSGVNVIGELLRADANLLAIIPAERIKAGLLPENAAIPAIAVTQISGVDRNILSQGETRRVAERVQVTVLASNYRQKRALLQLVRYACADKRGDIAGEADVVVLTDGTGPDFLSDDSAIWMQTQDFTVSYNEATS